MRRTVVTFVLTAALSALFGMTLQPPAAAEGQCAGHFRLVPVEANPEYPAYDRNENGLVCRSLLKKIFLVVDDH